MCRDMLSSVRVSETVYVVDVECITDGGRCCRFALQGMN